MRDVACAGYVAGCNVLFFAHDTVNNTYNTQNATTQMMERLSFSNDVGAKYASMLAFPATAGQFSSGHLDTVMSVTTRLLPWEVTSATGGDHHSFPGGQQVYQAYSNVLNLRSIHFGEDMKAAENQASSPQTRPHAATPPPRCLLRLFLCVRRTSSRKVSLIEHAPLACLTLTLTLTLTRQHQQRHVLHR